MLTLTALILFPALMAFAVTSDLVTMSISNKVSLALIVGFLLIALVAGMPAARIGTHLLAGLAVLAVTFTLFALNLIGGGDAKLAAATALWMGFSHLLDYLLMTALFGGVLSLCMISLRSHPWPSLITRFPWIAQLYRVDKGIPYGVALGLAGLLVYPSTELWQRAVAG